MNGTCVRVSRNCRSGSGRSTIGNGLMSEPDGPAIERSKASQTNRKQGCSR